MSGEVFSTGTGPDAWSDRDAPPWQAVHHGVALPIEFEALYLAQNDTFLHFAEIELGDSGTAVQVITDVFLYVLVTWDQMLAEPNFMEAAWEVLRAAVAYEKRRRHRDQSIQDAPSFFWKMTFGHAMVSSRAQFSREPDELRQAIAKLPPRQFDVIVLKHFMERSREDIAWLLGIKAVTVDHHHRRAQAHLRVLLRKPPLPAHATATAAGAARTDDMEETA
ncbi:RNA polymerase sigma factor (sigma-70 family) [Kitasatospora sp. MAA4]|uniref:sigma-70 family RNA polymerase sigma factor n=1 Tax=Kitasatospora sp. MAA4 TaxID=3035093 RepID=UPI0024740B4A|nr:sigma-70 family RNA polymerase sigma factor [Kitasatospora sp. MAA4]MDH6137895.1 RNA polymerase sigma factor (sigma-70 family) [Kitasatospora sp. MAA4]